MSNPEQDQNPAALHAAAVGHFARGDAATAIESWRRALSLDPAHYAARIHLAVCLHKVGRIADAKEEFEDAVPYCGPDINAHLNLARILLAEGAAADARLWIAQALDLQPASLEALHELGGAYLQARDFAAAADVYRKIRALSGDDRQALQNLCVCLTSDGKPAEAAVELAAADELVSRDLKLLRMKAEVAQILGDHQGALKCYTRILEQHPDDTKSLLRIMSTSPAPEDRARAEARLHIVAGKEQVAPGIWSLLAKNAYSRDGYERALEILDEGIARTGDAALLLTRALTLPRVAASHSQLAFARSQTLETLDRLIGGDGHIEDISKSVNATAFQVPYHGQSDKALQQKIAQAHLAVSPYLRWTAPHVGRRFSRKRLRVGFISSFFRSHSVGRMFGGFIEHINAAHFEKIVIRVGGKTDYFGENLDRSAESVVTLPADLDQARAAVAALELDVLVYADIGMDPFTTYLAFSRLAPVQMAWPGHPITSGIPTVDYFITSPLIETADCRDHYSEDVILLSAIPSFFPRQAKPVTHIDRQALQLPATGNLYVCPMTLDKFHPDIDAVLAEILRQDSHGKLVLVLPGGYWSQAFLERLTKSIPDLSGRLIILPYMRYERFLGLMSAADAVLDTFHVGGANTSYDAFSYGIPMVTRFDAFLPGRFTSGMYRRMGLGEYVATSDNDYVAFALRVANDRDMRRAASEKILARNDCLYADAGMVAELGERILEKFELSWGRL